MAECPKCQGPTWDNRPKKASGEFKSNAPDFACKDKTCGGKIWPPTGPLADSVARVMPSAASFVERPPALGDTDTQLITLWEDCARRATKLCDTMNNEAGGPVLDGVQVASLASTLYIARSRLLTGKGY